MIIFNLKINNVCITLYYKFELLFISNKQGQFKCVLISLRNSNNNYDYNCYVLIIIIIVIILSFKIISFFGSIIIIFEELHFENSGLQKPLCLTIYRSRTR